MGSDLQRVYRLSRSGRTSPYPSVYQSFIYSPPGRRRFYGINLMYGDDNITVTTFYLHITEIMVPCTHVHLVRSSQLRQIAGIAGGRSELARHTLRLDVCLNFIGCFITFNDSGSSGCRAFSDRWSQCLGNLTRLSYITSFYQIDLCVVDFSSRSSNCECIGHATV